MIKEKNLRLRSAEILAQVIIHKRNLNDVIAQNDLQPYGKELCFGVLRFYPQLNLYLRALLPKPMSEKLQPLEILLLIGFYELNYTNTAPYAVLNETVNAAKQMANIKFSQLVNAVLRNFLRKKEKLQHRFAQNEIFQTAHPEWLLKKIKQDWPKHAKDIFLASNAYPPMVLRVNQLKITREKYLELLKQAIIEAQICKENASGIFLLKPMSVEKLPGFFDGLCSVQDLSAQFAAPLLQLQPQLRVLDACAAPGGKTTHILECEPQLAEVVAVDIDSMRCQRIEENLTRLNLQARVVAANVLELAEGVFDRILLDAPCSATGVIRRHPDIKLLRRAQDITKFKKQQSEMLAQVWKMLAPNGLLLYATCSIMPEENEAVIEDFMRVHLDAKIESFTLPIGLKQKYGWQILPTPSGGDGFYYARLRKLLSS